MHATISNSGVISICVLMENVVCMYEKPGDLDQHGFEEQIMNFKGHGFHYGTGSLMMPKWPKLASMAQKICTL